LVQLVFEPVPDHLPTPQSVHPSVAEVAPLIVDYCPAGHYCEVHEVFEPAIENLPSSQSVQPSVFYVAADNVDF